VGYAGQTISYTLYTVMALVMENDRKRYWRVLFALPLTPLHCITINFFGCAYGVSRDILFFGNATKFAPEWTLMKGRCERVALLFRVRRFLGLAIRSAIHGDVPLGAFWLGWTETPWTPSGFAGWTTGKKPVARIPSPRLADALRRRKPVATPSSGTHLRAVRHPGEATDERAA
jgi:hypothetical protein